MLTAALWCLFFVMQNCSQQPANAPRGSCQEEGRIIVLFKCQSSPLWHADSDSHNDRRIMEQGKSLILQIQIINLGLLGDKRCAFIIL